MREFSEATFDIEKSYEYILSIQVSLNGFSFSILHPSNQIILFFKNTPLTISSNTLLSRRLKEWIESEELIQKPYKKVRLIVFGEKYTFVPSALNQPKINEEILHTLFENANTLQFAENLVETIHAKLLFAIPDGLNEVVQNSLGECEVIHPLKLIINSVLKKQEKETLVLFFQENTIQLVLVQNETLSMANNFKINHANDVVYYILTACKQFKVSLKEITVYYAGKSNYLDTSINELTRYCSALENLSTNKITNKNMLSEQLLSENITLFL